MMSKPKVGGGQHCHWTHFPKLLSLLQNEPRQSQQQEAALLEEVAVQFSGVYEFVGPNNPSAKQFGELFDALVARRLKHAQWRAAMRPEHLMQVLQCVRLLSRDETLRRKLDADALKGIFGVFDKEASAHFSGSITPFQVEILTEIASIVKRLAGEERGLDELVRCQVHPVLLRLLHSNDPTVLPLVLVALIGFAAHKDHYALVANTEGLDVVLHILQHYDLPFKRLAADLLALLARREAVVSELLAMNGLGRLVGQLQSGDAALTQSLLRVVCYMANGGAALQEMYQTGTIPILLSLVAAVVRDLAASPAASALPSSRITDMQLVCTALTRIAEDDELAYSIRQCNGVTLLGKLLLVQPAPTQDAKSAERAAREVDSLRAYAFRALRFLFSMERNRKVFKRLFPPDLFAAFIDVGHYTANLNAYAQLVSRFDDLSEKQRAGVAAALDDISSDREADALRTVKGGQYVVLEMLGKGAYGAVYRARRARGEALVALKEIPLSDMSIFGATDAERSAGLGRMCKEVEILSSLDHPNIVQYYESFADGPYLYIVMELVEGSSLLDHITSLAEKGRRMPESDIWQVLIAVSLALNYIHSQKSIVHRDLTPANIVLGQGPEGLRHSKIADFGLAKRLTSSVVGQSLVGTMPFTCPEIIQQEHYTEKADVWSLGCVVYHMMMLRPPFDGSNPLSVASKIVEGSYDEVTDPCDGPAYSMHLKQLQKIMMTVDPNKRPSTEEVGALLSSQLMSAMERLTANEQRLVRALQLERANHRRGGGSSGALHPALVPPPCYTTSTTTTTPTSAAASAHPTPFANTTMSRHLTGPTPATTNSTNTTTATPATAPDAADAAAHVTAHVTSSHAASSGGMSPKAGAGMVAGGGASSSTLHMMGSGELLAPQGVSTLTGQKSLPPVRRHLLAPLAPGTAPSSASSNCSSPCAAPAPTAFQNGGQPPLAMGQGGSECGGATSSTQGTGQVAGHTGASGRTAGKPGTSAGGSCRGAGGGGLQGGAQQRQGVGSRPGLGASKAAPGVGKDGAQAGTKAGVGCEPKAKPGVGGVAASLAANKKEVGVGAAHIGGTRHVHSAPINTTAARPLPVQTQQHQQQAHPGAGLGSEAWLVPGSGGLAGVGGAGFNVGSPQQMGYAFGSQRMVSLASSRLKPLADPILQILTQLHKVMWVEQLPPGLARDHRRRCVDAFRRALFGTGSTPQALKANLAKLLALDNDIIRDAQGQPVDFGSLSALGTAGADAGTSGVNCQVETTGGCLQYDQLSQIIESLLLEKGYYSQKAEQHVDPAIAELLPPSLFSAAGSSLRH